MAYHLLLVCASATLGGVISVSVNIRKIDVISGFGDLPFFLHGVARNIYAIIGAVFIYLAIRCNLVGGFIAGLDNVLVGLCAVGFLSGFSEQLVPVGVQ